VLFYVAPGGAEDLPELLEWLDWGGVRLDLTAVAEAELTDPPVRWLHPATVPMQRPGEIGVAVEAVEAVEAVNSVANVDAVKEATDEPAIAAVAHGADGAPRGGSRRAAYPTPGLPEPPELIALLATIAAACHRLAVAAAR
jgi:hypothetical protein